jgi:hypothetical protein
MHPGLMARALQLQLSIRASLGLLNMSRNSSRTKDSFVVPSLLHGVSVRYPDQFPNHRSLRIDVQLEMRRLKHAAARGTFRQDLGRI